MLSCSRLERVKIYFIFNNMHSPFFSVIIPLYNKSRYISQTINSVLSQTFTNFEIIIIDDGSTDEGPEIVNTFDDLRVLLISQKNRGVSSARNHGIRKSTGQYIAFLDADDEWEKNKLELHYKFIKTHYNCRWMSSGFIQRYKKRDVENIFSNTQIIPDALSAMCEGMTVWTGAIIVRRDCFTPDCLFNIDISRSEDREVWLKLACRFPEIGYIGEALAIYNIATTGGLTSTAVDENDFPFLTMLQRLDVFKKNLSGTRANLLEKHIRKYNRIQCLRLWVNNKSQLHLINGNIFKKNFSYLETFFLKKSTCLPLLVKKIIFFILKKLSIF